MLCIQFCPFNSRRLAHSSHTRTRTHTPLQQVRIVQMHRSKKDETSEVPEDVKNNYRTIAHPKYPPSALAPLSSGPELSDVIAHDGVDYMLLVASLVRDSRKYKHVWRSTCVENSGLFKRLCLLGEFQADPDDQLGQSPLKNVSNPREAVKVYTKQAEEAASSLFSLAKQICLKLNIDKLGIGPIKTEERALLKAKEKYNGDVRMVKDYSRCVIVCADYTQLLAGLLLVHSRCAKVLVRLKTRALTRVNEALKGGYRHAVANVLLKGHVCEVRMAKGRYNICGAILNTRRDTINAMRYYMLSLPSLTTSPFAIHRSSSPPRTCTASAVPVGSVTTSTAWSSTPTRFLTLAYSSKVRRRMRGLT